MVFRLLKAGYQKVKNALQKSRSLLGDKIRTLFSGPVDEAKIEALEEILYEADLGVKIATELSEKIRKTLRKNPETSSEALIEVLKEDLLSRIQLEKNEIELATPHVILVVGVNGNGKTTSCAKLAKKYQDQGLQVIFGAADTYRAAAQEQLELWSQRLQIPIVKGKPKSDPSAVAFDTLESTKAKGLKVAIIDTAGRLHTKIDLMRELEKIKRACNKVLPGAPHETLLVLDATVGQNALDQAKVFSEFTPISGLILTKLDGTAKGGIVIRIAEELKVPVKFIGVGEGIDDLEPFDPIYFVKSLFD
ncbi:MAG: signal recognition particle-docking protein FtsY [Chlamydiia bacterium]|nr:signal recognition particle-docking protein FtsY [Chlamydiia bacterium]